MKAKAPARVLQYETPDLDAAHLAVEKGRELLSDHRSVSKIRVGSLTSIGIVTTGDAEDYVFYNISASTTESIIKLLQADILERYKALGFAEPTIKD